MCMQSLPNNYMSMHEVHKDMLDKIHKRVSPNWANSVSKLELYKLKCYKKKSYGKHRA